MKKKTIGFILVVSLVIFSSFSFGQDLLIKNGTILTVTKGKILKGDILIIKGIIKQIEENIKGPKGIKIIDASGKFVIPGIIDSHTHIALSGTNENAEAITAEVKMRDVLNAEDRSIYTAISGGVTMVHTMHGSSNPIGGENIVIKTKWGKTSEEMIVHDAYRTLKFALGENPKRSNSPTLGTPRYPQSRMGVNAIIRREFLKAKNYMEQWDRYLKAKNSKKPAKNLIAPRKDLRMEQLADVLRGKMVARCHTYRA
ncbi:hypothetical protein LCGC14_1075560, partial [marine sediment metagenome]|nr:amidohydrolase [Candidatus Aminicenantes bacterium]